MPKIDINLPSSVTEEEAEVIRIKLQGELNSKWDVFKRNAKAFFDSLKGVLGYLWDKIANWARDFWNKYFG